MVGINCLHILMSILSRHSDESFSSVDVRRAFCTKLDRFAEHSKDSNWNEGEQNIPGTITTGSKEQAGRSMERNDRSAAQADQQPALH
jgi:hypothetical protein